MPINKSLNGDLILYFYLIKYNFEYLIFIFKCLVKLIKKKYKKKIIIRNNFQ